MKVGPIVLRSTRKCAGSKANTLKKAPSSQVGEPISRSEPLKILQPSTAGVLVGVIVARAHLVPRRADDLDRAAIDADVYVDHVAAGNTRACNPCQSGTGESPGSGAEYLLELQRVGTASGGVLLDETRARKVDGVFVPDVVGPGVVVAGESSASGDASGVVYISRNHIGGKAD